MDDPVLSRRSIRKYTAEPVTTRISSGCCGPPWRRRRRATSSPGSSSWCPTARRCAAITAWHPYAGMLVTRPWPSSSAATRAALAAVPGPGLRGRAENILIEAELLGLGAVWLGVYPLPERVAACAAARHPRARGAVRRRPVGHPAERKEPSDRYDPARVHRERW